MRLSRTARALLLTAALGASASLPAGDDATDRAEAPQGAPTGGLSLVPEQWRYRPAPAARIPPATASFEDSGAVHADPESLRSLSVDYIADRQSLVNTVRARRGLPLLTLWEGAGRCLFFGINDRGRAGVSLVRMRTLERRRGEDRGVSALYDALTGARRATFPDPLPLIAHDVR